MDQPRLGADHDVVVPVRCDPAGLAGPRRREAAGAAWRRTSRGFYVPAEVEESPVQRVAEAGVLVPRRTAVTGWGALCWLGAEWFTGTRPDGSHLPVPLAGARRTLREQPLLHLCEERIDRHEIDVVDGLRVTSAVRSVLFEVRYAASLVEAVVALDMAYAADLVTPEEVGGWVEDHSSYTGIGQARRAVGLADENSWSPQETRMRLRWLDLELGAPLANRPVFDLRGRHLATPDLVDPVAGVAGEYDGAAHLDTDRRRTDLGRDDRLRGAGLETFAVVAGEMRAGGAFEPRLRAAYSRAGERDAPRGWTLDPPSWWRETTTVAARRALPEHLRGRLLRRAA